MQFPDRIEAKPTVMLGKPCVKGTRIPVYLLLEKMAAGESFEKLLDAYPQLRRQDYGMMEFEVVDLNEYRLVFAQPIPAE